MTTSKLLASIDINPPNRPERSIIWLHGLGAEGSDFLPIVEQIALEDNARFVFPHAPIRPITINNGMKMRAWYDIAELSFSVQEDSQGVKESQGLIENLIDREINLGVPSQRITLAGFSQGGAMALYTGLRCNRSLGGIIALSCYLPLAKLLEAEKEACNHAIPIFMAHGLYDPIVPFSLGEATKKQLQALNYSVEWHSYSMPHTVIEEEIKDIASFLKMGSDPNH